MATLLPSPFGAPEELRGFERIRIVAIDIDGTLAVNPRLGIGDVLRHLRGSLNHHTREVTIVLATGRTWFGVKDVLDALKISGPTPLVLYNGAVTTNAAGSELSSLRVIPKESASRVVKEVIHSGGVAFLYECERLPRPRHRGRAFGEYVTGYGEPRERPEFDPNGLAIRWSEDLEVSEAAAILIPLSGTNDSRRAERQLEVLADVPQVDITASSSRYFEIRPRGATKSSALALIAERYGVASDSVLAIGDNDNDADMLEWAGIGVAVANCSPAAAAASDFISTAAAGEAVVEVLRLLRDARRFRSRESRL